MKRNLPEWGKIVLPFVPIIIVCICLGVFFKNKGFFSETKSELIISDAQGYYGYLPAAFIYHDKNFNYTEKVNQDYYVYNPLGVFYFEENGKRVNKFYIGTAVLMSPFFALAHLATKYSNYPTDGYSLYYQYFIGLAALFYLLLGLYFLNRIFRMYNIKPLLSVLLLTAVVFASNLYHYTIFEPGMSHVYSFALISAFLFLLNKSKTNFNLKIGILISIVLGLITLCRPTNILIILVSPFFFDNFSELVKWIKTNLFKWNFLLYVLSFLMILSIQILYWYKATGMFYVDSYKYEGFDFSNPYIIDFLFSFKKGFFIYSPFFLSLIIAFILLVKKNIYKSMIAVSFFVVVCFVLSSWWNWYYGGSFGMRSLIDFYPLWCCIIAISFNGLLIKNYSLLAIFTIVTIALNIIQDYQYRNYILHWECMDIDKYFKVFLKVDDKYKGVLFYDNITGNFEKYHNGNLIYADSCNFNDPNLKLNTTEEALYNFTKKDPKDFFSFVSKSNNYSKGIEIQTNFIKLNPHILVKTYCDIYVENESSAELIISIENNGVLKSWASKVLPNFIESEKRKWFKSKFHTVFFGVNKGDVLKYYLKYRSGKVVLIDNLKMKICEYKTKK